MKIGGTLGKIANNVKKVKASDVLLGAATGGATLAYQAATGDSAVDKLKGAVGGVAKPPEVKSADSTLYQTASNTLLNPVADQFQAAANNTQVTSNVDPAFRQYQLGLAQQLQMQANGQGPSLAQMQLQQATDQSLNNSLAAIRAQGGPNGALNARTAALAGANQMGQMGQNSAILRLQEQQDAQRMLGELAGQGRAGDINTNGQNIDAQIAAGDQRLRALGGLGNTRAQQLGVQGDVYTAQNNASLGQATARNQRDGQILGSLFTGAATLGGAMIGGPAGAVAGNAAGNAIAPSVSRYGKSVV